MADGRADQASNAPFCVAVDWGTSSFRLWLLDEAGAVLGESRGTEGMMHCAESGFEPVLKAHLEKAGAPAGLPILICGMAGARQGWLEAPYVETPARLETLGARAARVYVDWADIRILPGIAQRDATAPNVMRGEETQLLGALAGRDAALVCMPGTHCKWVRVSESAVTDFTTYMTGELFDVVGRHSILKHALAESTPEADVAAFDAALDRVLGGDPRVLSRLFEVRAAGLLALADPKGGAGHLSGLLVGSEAAEAKAAYGIELPVVLVAAGGLAERYGRALDKAGFEVEHLDAEEAVRTGLYRAATAIWEGDADDIRG